MTPERFAKLRHTLTRRQPDLTVLTDGIHKPHNVSAILRSCDAVGIYRLHAVTPEGDLHRHHMMAGGSKRWVDIQTHRSIESAVSTLRDAGWRLIVAHVGEGAQDFRDIDYTERVAIVLGSELTGLSHYALKHADVAAQIPMQGMVASLNVSVAAAVILFEAERQRLAAGLYEHSRLDSEEFARTLFEWSYPRIARRCRERKQAYPPLSDDGMMLENPLRTAKGAS